MQKSMRYSQVAAICISSLLLWPLFFIPCSHLSAAVFICTTSVGNAIDCCLQLPACIELTRQHCNLPAPCVCGFDDTWQYTANFCSSHRRYVRGMH
ncbi:hypothetical protein GDO78_001114 [Eleutherodactylus coqui]|uniref:Uncharacterized protein n=1 Tax=Eleutherodactylus coqui TaxID=57060 RepID=A0A8J6KN17_ELECQ|nr:hypothetical protein GDO78_001114 [Eleutherodactylus coqui]